MRGRPNLYTSYEAETQLFPTTTKKVLLGIGLGCADVVGGNGGGERSGSFGRIVVAGGRR